MALIYWSVRLSSWGKGVEGMNRYFRPLRFLLIGELENLV